MEEKSMEDRTAISFLSCFTSPLSSFSSSFSRNLLRAFSDEAHASGSGSLAQKPAIMANRCGGERELRTSFEVIGR